MPPLPESEFRSLLAGRSQGAFADFVADLWQARGREVRRDGDRLLVDGRELRPVRKYDGSPPTRTIVVTATPLDAKTDETILGPADLYHALLYDVPRERASDLFESHFDRPLEREQEAEADRTTDAATTSAETDDETAETDATDDETAGDERARGRWPRAREDALALLADPRTRIVAGVLLLVTAAALWGLFVYEPTPNAPEPPFAADDAPAPVDGSYRVVGQIEASGEGEWSYIEETWTYAPGDPAVATNRMTFGGTDDWSTSTYYRRGNVSYNRQTYSNASDYREHRERLGEDDIVWTSDRTRSIYRVQRSEEKVSAEPRVNLPAAALTMLPYERAGTTTYEGREVVRYVPTTGWIGSESGGRTFRVHSASGEILVDPETDALLYADVEATIVNADTWGDVLTEPEGEISISYRVEPGVERPRAPPWVEGLAATNETTG